MKLSVGDYVKCSCGGKTRVGKITGFSDEKATVKLYKEKASGHVPTKRIVNMAIDELEATAKPSRPGKKNLSNEIEIKNFAFRVTDKKEVSRDGKKYGQITGYASTFGNVDLVNDAVLPGAFKSSLNKQVQVKDYLQMLWMHDSREVIGGFSIKEMKDDENGLYVAGEINLDVQRGREAYSLVLQNVINSMSIGFRTLDYDYSKDGVRLLKELDLVEISLVGTPANPRANILNVKSNGKKSISIDELLDIKTREDFNAVLRKSGAFSRSACEYLAAQFGKLSKSAEQEKDTKKETNAGDVKSLLSSELKNLIEALK
jgi:HK97 family phage prohead protease